AIPRELPPDVYGFVGREDQLRELDGLLDRRGATTAVISAVSGTPGVGKTALAIHWAHRVRDRFPDGDLYVDLQGFGIGQPVETTDVLAGFLRGLGVPNHEVPAGEHERASRYRSLLTGRRVLIVLDNARTAEQVRPLLPGSGSCAVVVTSRDRLSDLRVADGARRIDLDVLPPRESIALLEAVLGDRVAREPEAAAQLCTWAAHLPLALRIIGMLAHDRTLEPLSTLAGELSDENQRLDLLEAVPSERWSVRVVFSWSYRHLPAAVARCFRLVACIPGRDFSVRAVAELLDEPEPAGRRLLEALLRANLVEHATGDRLRMHDLLRAYAASLADEEETAEALQRLLDHYGRRARTESAESWLAEELPTLVAAFELAVRRGWDRHLTALYRIIQDYLWTAPDTEGMTRTFGEVQLLRATAALLADDAVTAQRYAAAAERVFGEDDETRAGVAALVRLRALVADTSAEALDHAVLVRHADEVVARLTRAGLHNEAAIARLLRHRVRIRAGDLSGVESDLRPRPGSSVDRLILLRLTRVEFDIARGDVRSALEYAYRGVVEWQRYQRWTSGLDFVGSASSYGQEIANTTRALVTERMRHDPGTLFDWLELVRGSALGHRPPRMTTGRDAVLRHVLTSDDENLRPPRVNDRVLAALGSRVLVTFVPVDDRLSALMVRDGRHHLVGVGDLDTAVEWTRRLHDDVNALAPDHLPQALHDAVAMSTRRSAQKLDDHLFGPLTDLIADRELVLVPPAELLRVIWPALPSLTGRAVTVVPSAATWLACADQPPRTGHPVAG
ncbi:MAG: NB-ARC domain-containing protein, partial [Actinomycetota bacterium]|nr:NB-ARC domain-containing protein [Actinomycetota bacterium]